MGSDYLMLWFSDWFKEEIYKIAIFAMKERPYRCGVFPDTPISSFLHTISKKGSKETRIGMSTQFNLNKKIIGSFCAVNDECT